MLDHRRSFKQMKDLARSLSLALAKTEEIKKELANLHRQKLICPQNYQALRDKVELLFNVLLRMEDKLAGPTRPAFNSKGRFYIDGRELTPKEAAFEEYCRERFDELDWLKKYGIVLEMPDDES